MKSEEINKYTLTRHKKWIILLWTIWIFLMKIKDTISVDVDQEIYYHYCREEVRPITSEDLDEYLIIDSELDATIQLDCHFCDEKYNQQPKIWFLRDRYSLKEKEVNIGMDNNMSLNRIRVSPDLSLIIRDFNQNDSGIYRCHGKEGQEADKKFNYKLEAVYKDKTTENLPRGNLSDWQKYHEAYLAPIGMRFAVSKMLEIAIIRKAGIHLELITEWGPWGPCEKCRFGRGIKTTTGFCRIKTKIDQKHANNQNDTTVVFFRSSPLLPCRSIELGNYPGISKATRYLPEFILEKKCKKCKKVKKRKSRKYKYKKRYILADGAHLTISCPESTLETQVSWRKDGFLLEKGKGHSFRKQDPEPRVFVDTFSTLYLKEVSVEEDGVYTCFVDNAKMMKLKVIVTSKSRIFTKVFVRHLIYLALILILASICYCSGLVAVYKRKDKFEIQDYKEILARREETEAVY